MTDDQLMAIGSNAIKLQSHDLLVMHGIRSTPDLSDENCLSVGREVYEARKRHREAYENDAEIERARRAALTPEQRAYEDGYRDACGGDWC